MKNSPKAAKGSAVAKKKPATKASPGKKGRSVKAKSPGNLWMRDDEPKKNSLKYSPGAADKLRKVGNKRVAAVKTSPSSNKQPAKGRKAKTPVKSPPKKRELEEANSIEQHIEAEEPASTSKSPARRGRGPAKSSVVGIKTEPPKTPTKSPGKKGKTKGKSGAVNSSENVVDNEEVINGEEPKTPSKASPRGKKGAAKSSPKQKKGRAASSAPKTPEKPSPRKRKSESGNQSTSDDMNSAEEAGTPTKRRRLDVKSSANVNSNDQVVNGEEPQTRGRKAVGKGRGAKNATKSPAAKSPRSKKIENEIAASIPGTEGGRTPRKSSAKSSSGSPKALKKKPAKKAGRPTKSVKSKSPKKSRASKI